MGNSFLLRMNGAIGSYIIKPDQMQLINPAFILILIPLFDAVVYPFFAKYTNEEKIPISRKIINVYMNTITQVQLFGPPAPAHGRWGRPHRHRLPHLWLP